MDALIEIIIPTYNSGLYIAETIESIQRQDYKNWKILISDNSSTDNTCSIVEKYLSDNIILYKQTSNLGPHANFNFLIKKSQAPFVKLFCSDDVMLPWALSSQVECMLKNESISVCSSHMILVNEKLQPSHQVKSLTGIIPQKLIVDECSSQLKNLVGGPSNIMARGEYLRKCECRSTYKYISDMILIMDLCSYGYYTSVDHATYLYRRHSESDTNVSCAGEVPWHDWANFIIENKISNPYALCKVLRKTHDPEKKQRILNYAKSVVSGSLLSMRCKEFLSSLIRRYVS